MRALKLGQTGPYSFFGRNNASLITNNASPSFLDRPLFANREVVASFIGIAIHLQASQIHMGRQNQSRICWGK
jgi:hypothetical protein